MFRCKHILCPPELWLNIPAWNPSRTRFIVFVIAPRNKRRKEKRENVFERKRERDGENEYEEEREGYLRESRYHRSFITRPISSIVFQFIKLLVCIGKNIYWLVLLNIC